MNILIADHNKSTIASINECKPSFDVELGNPLAFDIDAVVSPANTKGIMNGGYDAVLRRYFGMGIEYMVSKYFDKFKLDVGEAIEACLKREDNHKQNLSKRDDGQRF